MRDPTISTVSYQPNQVPNEIGALPMFLRDELDRLAAVVRLLASGHLDPVYTPPLKPRFGDLVLADGTQWDPGSGEGVYRFTSTGTWAFLG